MAEQKSQAQEREYIIPLRKEILKVPAYRRSARAVKAIKQFVAKHMKVADRDVSRVKLGVYFNNHVWLRGKTNPPAKVHVKATRDGENVKVTFVEMPKHVSFQKAKNEKLHKPADVKPVPTETPKADAAKTDEQKSDEKEKEKAVAATAEAQAKSDAKAQKHVTKADKTQRPQRMTLQK